MIISVVIFFILKIIFKDFSPKREPLEEQSAAGILAQKTAATAVDPRLVPCLCQVNAAAAAAVSLLLLRDGAIRFLLPHEFRSFLFFPRLRN